MERKRHCNCLKQEFTTPLTSLPLISISFTVETKENVRKGRKERMDSNTFRLYPDKEAGSEASENSPRPHSSDAPLHFKSCCQYVIVLWLAIKPKQLNM